LDPSSPSYTQIVGTVAMPNVGDELHHFGWNRSGVCSKVPNR
jgi:methanethiol oxidase